LRHQWGDLTDDDFDRAAGSKDELVGAIQKRYGQTKDEVERQLDKLAGQLSGTARQSTR
jgi:uncharacterized protein YjbJ (UPF0337 family)